MSSLLALLVRFVPFSAITLMLCVARTHPLSKTQSSLVCQVTMPGTDQEVRGPKSDMSSQGVMLRRSPLMCKQLTQEKRPPPGA